MKRPARVAGRHRGLRALHVGLRVVLVGALVVLLTLIAVREVAGLPAAADAPVVTSASTPAPGTGLPASGSSTPSAGAADTAVAPGGTE